MTSRPAIGSSTTFPDLVVGAVGTARIVFLNDEIVMMRRRAASGRRVLQRIAFRSRRLT
jgi:hypothetical protein